MKKNIKGAFSKFIFLDNEGICIISPFFFVLAMEKI